MLISFRLSPTQPMVGWAQIRTGDMNIEKSIALFLSLVVAIYGYTAFFGMDHLLPPILQRNPVWPSTFPKILSVMGLVTCSLVFLNFEKSEKQIGDDLDISDWRNYKIFHAFLLIIGMIAYALILRPLGFISATFIFLFASSLLLGEKKHVLLVIVCLLSSFSIWYLVDDVLGIYMSPLPSWFSVR